MSLPSSGWTSWKNSWKSLEIKLSHKWNACLHFHSFIFNIYPDVHQEEIKAKSCNEEDPRVLLAHPAHIFWSATSSSWRSLGKWQRKNKRVKSFLWGTRVLRTRTVCESMDYGRPCSHGYAAFTCTVTLHILISDKWVSLLTLLFQGYILIPCMKIRCIHSTIRPPHNKNDSINLVSVHI